MHDRRIERQRQFAANDELDRSEGNNSGSSGQVGVTVSLGSYPTVAGSYFAINPTAIGGTECEGCVPTIGVDATSTYFAVNLGTSIPPVGTKVITEIVDDGRWAFVF